MAEAADHPREPERFAEDFEAETEPQEEEADADERRPLEASYEVAPADVYAAQAPAYVVEPPPESPERSRPATLPIAVTLVLGLLAGFAAGYFVGSRDRGVAPAPTPTAGAPPAPTPKTARSGQQWSEQAVTPPATTSPAAGGGASTAPPDTARETPPAPRDKSTPPSRPLATKGRLVVQSTPSRAGVTVNGRWAGRTPLTLENLALGPYVVRVVQPGYEVERREIALTGRDASHMLSVRLQPERASAPPTRTAPNAGTPPVAGAPAGFTGSLFVDSRPQGARVLLDGRNVGKTPMMIPEVRVGAHVVRIELDEHRPWSATTTVTAGRESRVTGSLERFR